MFNFLTPNGMPYSSSLGNNSSVPGATISDALNALLGGGGGGSLQASYDLGNTILTAGGRHFKTQVVAGASFIVQSNPANASSFQIDYYNLAGSDRLDVSYANLYGYTCSVNHAYAANINPMRFMCSNPKNGYGIEFYTENGRLFFHTDHASGGINDCQIVFETDTVNGLGDISIHAGAGIDILADNGGINVDTQGGDLWINWAGELGMTHGGVEYIRQWDGTGLIFHHLIADPDFTWVDVSKHVFWVDEANNAPHFKFRKLDSTIVDISLNNTVKFDRVPSERKNITPITPGICVSGAVSGDGKYIVIGDYDEVSGIFVSSDSGASFTTVGPVYQYFKSAVSHYGQYMLVASYGNQEVVLSVDSGATWNNVPDLTGIASWLCVGISDNGEYMAAAGDTGDIWVSSDFGSNWNNIYPSGGVPSNISISGDGKYILVTYSGAGATLKLSSDYGATFAPVINPVGVVSGWLISAVSFSGQYMIATTGSLKRVYISYDYGTTWTRHDTINNVWYSAMSASGEIMYYSDDTTFELYQSLDYGVTWNVVSDPAGVGCDWSNMSCSGDGSLVLEVGRSAGINLYTYSMDVDFLSMPIKNRAFDSDIYASHSMIWLDENTNTVGVKIKKSDSTTFNAMFMHGKKIVEKILMPCVASGGVTASGADVFPAYGSRASVILDLNSSRWSSIGIPVVRFGIVGRQATAGAIMAYFRLYNQTDGVDIAGSVLRTNLTATYQVLTCTIPLENFPLTEKVISVQTSTVAGGSVALYSAEIEIEWTLF